MAKRLSKEKERYLAAHRDLNPRTTQVESSHESLSRDMGVLPLCEQMKMGLLQGHGFVRVQWWFEWP